MVREMATPSQAVILENLENFSKRSGGVRHEIRPIRMRYFSVVFVRENINFVRSGCLIFRLSPSPCSILCGSNSF